MAVEVQPRAAAALFSLLIRVETIIQTFCRWGWIYIYSLSPSSSFLSILLPLPSFHNEPVLKWSPFYTHFTPWRSGGNQRKIASREERIGTEEGYSRATARQPPLYYHYLAADDRLELIYIFYPIYITGAKRASAAAGSPGHFLNEDEPFLIPLSSRCSSNQRLYYRHCKIPPSSSSFA